MRRLEVAASYQTVVYGLAKATGGEQLLAGEPGGVFRRQKDSDGGDVARLADAAERSLRDGGLLEIRSEAECDRRGELGPSLPSALP
jgi:hypothetical protein